MPSRGDVGGRHPAPVPRQPIGAVQQEKLDDLRIPAQRCLVQGRRSGGVDRIHRRSSFHQLAHHLQMSAPAGQVQRSRLISIAGIWIGAPGQELRGSIDLSRERRIMQRRPTKFIGI